MSASATLPPNTMRLPRLGRNTAIVGAVLLLHGAGLWALQSGLLRRAAEVVIPAEILVEFITPAPPAPEPAPQPVPPPPQAAPPVPKPQPPRPKP
ncbi:MAG: energy transducer TonB, partial [Ottowia sp.]